VEERTVADSRSVLVHWMGPTDANSAGFVHGGVVMKLVDEVAGLTAVRHSHCRVVTAAADRMTFLQPIHIGELVTLKASLNAAWNTSMEVGVRVEAENPRTGEVRHTNTAYLTLVAVDDEGRPATVPPLRVDSADERRREAEAQLRRTNRLAEREQIVERRRADD
jgi:acyl-CoA hydrolase